jgi:hypothetical protein
MDEGENPYRAPDDEKRVLRIEIRWPKLSPQFHVGMVGGTGAGLVAAAITNWFLPASWNWIFWVVLGTILIAISAATVRAEDGRR